MDRPDLDSLFAETDFAHRLRLDRREPEEYFRAARHPDVEEPRRRRHLLTAEAARYAPCTDHAREALEETVDLFRAWNVPLPDGSESSRLADLGAATQADLVWMRTLPPEPGPRMVAGAVCSPSSWDPAEKLGRTLAGIHDVVPRLNAELGPSLDTFLQRLRPGIAWCRANWGLSAAPELNQHPDLPRPRLGPDADPARVWVRLEHQALIAQPRTGSILFAIRVEVLPFRRILDHPRHARGMARALASMPLEMARYKGLEPARARLVSLLEAGPPATGCQKQY